MRRGGSASSLATSGPLLSDGRPQGEGSSEWVKEAPEELEGIHGGALGFSERLSEAEMTRRQVGQETGEGKAPLLEEMVRNIYILVQYIHIHILEPHRQTHNITQHNV